MKKDKIKLKEQVLKILQDNNNVHTELKSLKQSPLNEKHEQLTNDAIDKLKSQIENLREVILKLLLFYCMQMFKYFIILFQGT